MWLVLFCKWLMSPLLIVGGLYLCRAGFQKRDNEMPFRFSDLLGAQTISASSARQLFIEGGFCIAMGIVVFAIL